ncbi:DUF4145 domain-containing protein [Desulforamulus aquiferis]|uniref:DUF4145 domain-containing protein n=1 Tax=Desulforamulus aquiferis TaxID=1397668 RepID=A0AAW7ZCR4_9FIRM|nr:DUF4145 domain-containing protein [Desulforamulus aquiferis]MDO7787233.1 DUF4145 domain-containing protein [Desulforamulus aquiferis]
MNCPHCRIEFHDRPMQTEIGRDIVGYWYLIIQKCPACKRFILQLTVNGEYRLVWPRSSLRSPCPKEVPNTISEDYTEACIVLADSPKASAALSRRCLQNILRETVKVKPCDLAKEIEQVVDNKILPTHIAEALHTLRIIGNFAAHPIKSQKTGDILPVEPGEAEWNLDVLESLFDFLYVQPERLRKREEAINQKLVEAGKKPLW